jgi:riboflavin biosynthesis pyrimidine reductase
MPLFEPPLIALLDRAPSADLPLPPDLRAAYAGPLGFPAPVGRPYVVANFVTTLDGVVSYALPGQAGGGPISGFNPADRFIMGLLRACADAVVSGAGTLNENPDSLWTPESVYSPADPAYAALRRALDLPREPTAVIVTGDGEVDRDAAIFGRPELPALILTTEAGARRLAGLPPGSPRVEALGSADPIPAAAILDALAAGGATRVLVEGGPRLLGSFLKDGRIDELFYTLAPQLAGRDRAHSRPALVEGQAFMPDTAPWGRLLSARLGGEHLFLRYALSPPGAGPPHPPAP